MQAFLLDGMFRYARNQIEMGKIDTTEKGVIFASFLLILMATPFFLLTSLMIILLLFTPLVTVISFPQDDIYSGYESYMSYVVLMSVMAISFLISYGLISSSVIIKANYFRTNDRKAPKSYLYDFTGFLLGLIGIVLMMGGVMGITAAGFLCMMMDSKYWVSENIMFLIVISLSGVLSIIVKKFLLRLDWWRN